MLIAALTLLAPPVRAREAGAREAGAREAGAREAGAREAGAAGARGAEVVTSTMEVEDVAVDGAAVWVATRGGVERYERTGLGLGPGLGLGLARRYTTADGLAANHVLDVEASGGTVRVRTRDARCELVGERFACAAAPPFAVPPPGVAERFAGARVTATVALGRERLVATAGAGLWLDGASGPRRLSPRGQICGNHVTAAVRFRGRTWLGTFDRGLCVREDDGTYRSVEGAFRMVNALAVTPRGLFVASGEGVFATRDGRRFERVALVEQAGANGLAFDGRSLWITTPGALWRLRVRGGPRDAVWWRPGGSAAVQRVAVAGGVVWLATEDRGAVRFAKDRFTVFDRAAGMPSSWALDVAVGRDGTAWVATLRHGLVAISPKGQPRRVGGVGDAWLLHVSVHDDGVWVGTQGGAFRVADDGSVRRVDGLPDGRVHVVARLADGLWLGTEGGLLRLENGV
jgi:ligand-binding sensor domain-containing protein